MTNFLCSNCNKIFKTNSGLWKHNKKYHTEIISDIESDNDNSSENIQKNTPEEIISEPSINKIYSCKFCYKKLSNRISKVEELIYKNGDHKKIYLEQINMISYNKKNLIRDTWNRILFDKVI